MDYSNIITRIIHTYKMMLTRAIINTVQTYHLRAYTASTITQAKIPSCDLNTGVYVPVHVEGNDILFLMIRYRFDYYFSTYWKLMINNDEFSICNHSKEIQNMR